MRYRYEEQGAKYVIIDGQGETIMATTWYQNEAQTIVDALNYHDKAMEAEHADN
jgi:hypothetical protein